MHRVHRANTDREGMSQEILGLFGIMGPFIWLRSTSDEIKQAIDHFIGKGGISKQWKTPSEIKPIDLDEEIRLARTIIVYFHEDHHYTQIMSSPLGLFEAKWYLQQIGDAYKLFLPLVEKEKALPVPLIKLAQSRLPTDMNAQLAYDCWSSWKLFRLLFWYDAITESHYACWLLNLAINRMIESQWESYSHYDKNREVYIKPRIAGNWSNPASQISTTKIIEAHADLMCIGIVDSMPLSDNAREVCRGEIERSVGIRDVCNYATDICGELSLRSLLCLLDLSLLTLIDPCYHDIWPRDMYWEDVNPVCRLTQILDVARQITSPKDEDFIRDFSNVYLSYVEEISSKCGWPSVRDIHTRGSEIKCLLDPNEPYMWQLPTKLISLHAGLSQVRLQAPGFTQNPGLADLSLANFWNEMNSQYAFGILGGSLHWGEGKRTDEECVGEFFDLMWMITLCEAVETSDFPSTRNLSAAFAKSLLPEPADEDEIFRMILKNGFGVEKYKLFEQTPGKND